MPNVNAKKLFEILVHENADMLTVYLRAAVRDSTAVDDLFQETFLIAWKRLADYDTDQPFAPWLRGIAAKQVLAYYRQSVKRDKPCGPEVLDQLDTRFERLQRLPGDTFNQKLDALRMCVDLLPAKYREPVELRYHRELDIASTAARLALQVEAVKKRLQRAKKRLHDCLERRLLAVEGG